MNRKLTLDQACARYPHRFTMEHKPQWARLQRENGTYYAPQYRSDAEWFANTVFPGEGDIGPRERYCCSKNQTWPLGQSLDAPFKVQA